MTSIEQVRELLSTVHTQSVIYDGGFLLGMDRETFCKLMSELRRVYDGHIDTATIAEIETAHAKEAEKVGLTKIEFMGGKVCICPWVNGMAVAPFSAKITPLTHAFVTGHFR